MRVGQARKRDWNEPEIVSALQRVGALVGKLSAPGLPDLLVCWRGRLYAMEVKGPRGRATLAQVERLAEGWPVVTVRTPDEALKAIGVRSEGRL